MQPLTVGVISAMVSAFIAATSPFVVKYTQGLVNNSFPVFVLTLAAVMAAMAPVAAGIAFASFPARRAALQALKDWRYVGMLILMAAWMLAGSIVFTYGTLSVSNSQIFLLMAITASAFALNFLIARIWFPENSSAAMSVWSRLKAEPPVLWLAIAMIIGGIVLAAYVQKMIARGGGGGTGECAVVT